MPFIVWTNDLSVDVKMLDNDHKRLAILINDMHESLMSGRDSKVLEQIFDELIACSRLHFANEEQFLDQAGYSGAVAHRQEHEKKIEQILVLQVRFSDAKGSAGYIEVLDQLKEWLFKHIENSDKAFMAHLKTTGVDSILATWDEPK